MRFVPVIILAIAILAAPLVWLLVSTLMSSGPTTFGGSAVDSSARIEIEQLRQQMEGLQDQISTLQKQIQELGTHGPAAPGPGEEEAMPHEGPNAIIDAYAQVVLIANRLHVNDGLDIATPSYLASVFGVPSDNLNDNCGPMTNPKLKDLLEVRKVGPITVQMLKPALDSLQEVFDKIQKADPDLYARINTAGSLCVRLVRGSDESISNHAFGLAVDLNIDGKLDTLGDGKTQLGLTILADFFKSSGWIWGAGFGREDSMHFEVGKKLADEWHAEGKL